MWLVSLDESIFVTIPYSCNFSFEEFWPTPGTAWACTDLHGVCQAGYAEHPGITRRCLAKIHPNRVSPETLGRLPPATIFQRSFGLPCFFVPKSLMFVKLLLVLCLLWGQNLITHSKGWLKRRLLTSAYEHRCSKRTKCLGRGKALGASLASSGYCFSLYLA